LSDMDYLRSLKGKHVWVKASHRMNRFGLIQSHYRVVDVIESTRELFLEPLIPEYKDRLVLLPISFYGIEWEISSVSESNQTEAEKGADNG
jgi:hypothetical protein